MGPFVGASHYNKIFTEIELENRQSTVFFYVCDDTFV